MSEDYDKLSPLGEEQARKLGQFWARHGISFDRVFHGPAKRHIHTMQIAGEEVRRAGLPWPEPVGVSDLDEFDAFAVMRVMVPVLSERDQEGPLPLPDLPRGTADTRRWTSPTIPVRSSLPPLVCLVEDTPGLESWTQFRARVSSALDGIRTSISKSSSVAVFTSGGTIASAVGHALDLRPEKSIEFVWLSRNCSYSEFLSSDDRFSLSSFNSFPHFDDKALLTYR